MTPFPLGDGATYLNLDAVSVIYDFGAFAVCHYRGGDTLNLTGDDRDRLIALLVKNGGKAAKTREHPATDPANIAKAQRRDDQANPPPIPAGDPANADPRHKGA